MKISFLFWAIKEPRLFCLRDTALPASRAPSSLQATFDWQSDSCMYRKWGHLKSLQHSLEDWLYGEAE